MVLFDSKYSRSSTKRLLPHASQAQSTGQEWRRTYRSSDPTLDEQWKHDVWPQGWILAFDGGMVHWHYLDTPEHYLQQAHAYLVFHYQELPHEWSVWIASVFVQEKYRRMRYGFLLAQTVREWHPKLAIRGLILSGTPDRHDHIRQFWRSQSAILDPMQVGCYSDGSTKYVTSFFIQGGVATIHPRRDTKSSGARRL